MSYRCYLLRRKFVPYLEGGLPPREAGRIEEHLAGCRTCGERLTTLRAGGNLLQTLSTTLAVRVLLALVLAQSVLLVVSNWRTFRPANEVVAQSPDVRGLRGFTPVRIPEFSANSQFQIVTEGFVQGVYFDEQERTLHIKLVEVPNKPEPFVICEVRNLGDVIIPRQGNRVRVYGTARYDAQPGRGWHEVNPVLTLAVLKR